LTQSTKEKLRVSLPHNGWLPRADQRALWDFLRLGGKRAVEVAHRRWGKDDVALHFSCIAAHKRIGNYWHMLPEYNQARKSVWDAVNPRTGHFRIDDAFPQELRSSTRATDMAIKFHCGSMWQLVGSDNFNSYVGSPPIGVVFSEYAISNPLAWAYISPILEENGGWALFISTSRGNNHLKAIYDFAKNEVGWFSELMPATKTEVFTPEQLERIEREYIATYGEESGKALFRQEYLCSFDGAVYGSYYSKQIAQARADKRICSVPWATGSEVYTFWDLGVDDSTTIWFMQMVGKEFRFIDYHESTGEGLAHYAKVIKEKPYVYGDHYMPHDAAQRSLQTGKSTQAVAEELGIRPIHVVPRAKDSDSVLGGIEMGRNILSQCWFDEKKCARGLSALEGYRAEYDEDKKKLGNKPLHDWTSHGADAFRTFSVGFDASRLFVEKSSGPRDRGGVM